jgi:hypothetical protein
MSTGMTRTASTVTEPRSDPARSSSG